MKTLHISIVLSFLLLLGGAAFAQQSTAPTITFNVPLQFNDLHPDVQAIQVTCTVFEGVGSTRAVADGTQILENLPASGDLNQTLTLVARQLSGKDITLATTYAVAFIFKVGGTWGTPSQAGDAPIALRAKEGTPFAQLNRGDVHF